MTNAQSTQHTELAFDLADRMRKALRVGGVSVQEIADSLEVSRNAVSSWINGRNKPRHRDLRDFALRTGVPLQWLETGHEGAPGDDPARESPLSDSNRRPPLYKTVGSGLATVLPWPAERAKPKTETKEAA